MKQILPACLFAAMASSMANTSHVLFNGKDLSQWEPTGKAEWRVEDGVIAGGQDGDPKRSGILVSKGSYKDSTCDWST